MREVFEPIRGDLGGSVGAPLAGSGGPGVATELEDPVRACAGGVDEINSGAVVELIAKFERRKGEGGLEPRGGGGGGGLKVMSIMQKIQGHDLRSLQLFGSSVFPGFSSWRGAPSVAWRRRRFPRKLSGQILYVSLCPFSKRIEFAGRFCGRSQPRPWWSDVRPTKASRYICIYILLLR